METKYCFPKNVGNVTVNYGFHLSQNVIHEANIQMYMGNGIKFLETSEESEYTFAGLVD